MKILATADIHFSREHQAEALASLTVLAETAERERPALVALSGDLFHNGIQNSAASGFPALLAVIQRILDVCPIAAVHGTPTHDLPGCYDALTKLRGTKGKFFMVTPGDPITLAHSIAHDDELLILGCPEPSREWILAGNEGGSAADAQQALKDGLRSILLGLGAIRAQHPDLPCVFLYHGPVEGASMQNGQTIGAGSITIGREDLALVGADYYALGDIHLAQQIPGLPAYYPGSAYPVSWGELGQSGFNLVEIDRTEASNETFEFSGPWQHRITRVNYPHARRIKSVIDWKDADEPLDHPVDGVQVWQVYRATKEEAKEIDVEEILHDMRNFGALEGSRVTVELIPTETVRAAGIQEATGLCKKVTIYSENSGQNIPEGVPSKADLLEREAAERGQSSGMHFRLRRLRLRGAVGIWKGQRKDEIDITLDEHDPGLIALIGANGAGKSTLIENMHPYPCMLTRDGKLQDHFRLRDSLRELWFCDERTGTEYRSLMEIDGANSSGSVKYHLFRGGEPMTDGRKESYLEAIERLIGSLPLFLRSAFVSQRPTKSNPDLADATKGEKKAIFRELAGLDYLQGYAESAKARADALEQDLATGRGQVTILEGVIAAGPAIRAEAEEAAHSVVESDAEITRLESTGKDLKHQVEQLTAMVAEEDRKEREADETEKASARSEGDAELARIKIEGLQATIAEAPGARERIARHETLKAEEGHENDRLTEIHKANAAVSTQYTDALRAHQTDVSRLQGAKAKAEQARATRQGERNVLQARQENARSEVARDLKACPRCGYVDPSVDAARAQLHEKLAQWEQDAKAIDHDLLDLSRQVKEAEANLIALIPPVRPASQAADETELKRIRSDLAQINVEKARKIIEIAGRAEGEIASLQAQIQTLQIEAENQKAKAEALRAELTPQIREDHAEADRQLEQARQDYTEAKEARAGAVARLQAAEKRLDAIAEQATQLETLKAALEAAAREAQEWRYLEAACGADGIQALELDALGPSISATANRVLSAAYNTRFQIEIKTTRMAGKGAKTKLVEDFEIVVHDNELLTEQALDTLSGGESIWVKQAVYAAFSIIRDQTTGVRFLTAFKDECDGALDPESRAKYFQMLEAEHNESGRRHTLIITHSESAQETIQQKIEMRRAS